MRTRSEEPYRANCCARYPLPEGVREYVVSSLVRSKRIARTPVLLPKGAIYLGTPKYDSVGKVQVSKYQFLLGGEKTAKAKGHAVLG